VAARAVVIVGGGIVGLATGRALLRDHGVVPVILEAEERVGTHQTGHNSGVLHSGLYYQPGSRKARDCVAGRVAMLEFCREHGVAHECCGKLVLATTEAEVAVLERLAQRGMVNGLEGLRRVGAGEIGEFEPHARGHAALWVPQTGIVDFGAVARALAHDLQKHGATIVTSARVQRIETRPGSLVVGYGHGEIETRALINCAGLQSDRVARLCGLDPGLRIVPFRGEYYRLAAGRESLVRNLLYPVPDARFPFLGVHFTRKLGGEVEIGPNAVLAWSRGRYGRFAFSARDAWSSLSYPGFWKLAARNWRFGVAEMRRSASKRLFWTGARQMIPDLALTDLERNGMGIRAQAIDPSGSLVDDFRIVESDRTLHVVNAPSPAATASLAIGQHISGLARRLV